MRIALPALPYLDDGRVRPLGPVRRHWPILAILLANLLAAITLFMAGKWVGDTNRYDGCSYVDTGSTRFWACPIEDPVPANPPVSTDV